MDGDIAANISAIYDYAEKSKNLDVKSLDIAYLDKLCEDLTQHLKDLDNDKTIDELTTRSLIFKASIAFDGLMNLSRKRHLYNIEILTRRWYKNLGNRD